MTTTMNSMQRKFGKLMNKNPGDNAKVSVLLNDYEDVDRVLAKVSTSVVLLLASILGVIANYLPQNRSTKAQTHGVSLGSIS